MGHGTEGGALAGDGGALNEAELKGVKKLELIYGYCLIRSLCARAPHATARGRRAL
jgi:hypothetical protein